MQKTVNSIPEPTAPDTPHTPDTSDDFSFGGSPEEVAEAVKRNAELADSGFKLSNTEEEHLRPKVYDGEDSLVNSIAMPDYGEIPEIGKAKIDLKGWDTFGEMPIGVGQFQPKKTESIWKQLYFAQRSVISNLEKMIEELDRELHNGKS